MSESISTLPEQTVIRSRGEDTTPVEMGAGSFTLHMNQAELYLVTALLYMCRLGYKSIYAVAAGTLLDSISATLGDDEMMAASDDVGVQATIEDYQNNMIFQTDSTNFITLEV